MAAKRRIDAMLIGIAKIEKIRKTEARIADFSLE